MNTMQKKGFIKRNMHKVKRLTSVSAWVRVRDLHSVDVEPYFFLKTMTR